MAVLNSLFEDALHLKDFTPWLQKYRQAMAQRIAV